MFHFSRYFYFIIFICLIFFYLLGFKLIISVQFSSVAQLCLTLCDPMNHSTPGLPVQTNSWSPSKPMSIESVMPSNHLIPVIHFSPCPQTFPASGSFPMTQLFT